jgi:hypothetical protein
MRENVGKNDYFQVSLCGGQGSWGNSTSSAEIEDGIKIKKDKRRY